eukprot:3171027-Amphidinium_carterae.1
MAFAQMLAATGLQWLADATNDLDEFIAECGAELLQPSTFTNQPNHSNYAHHPKWHSRLLKIDQSQSYSCEFDRMDKTVVRYHDVLSVSLYWCKG